MKISTFSVAVVAALSAVEATEQVSIHLRINEKGGGVGDWGACTGGQKCSNPSSVCVKYSNYYSQCKPATLPAGELCGQKDAANDWKYDKCPSSQKCTATGTDFRCTNKKQRRKTISQRNWGSCTITNESQCDGQNWTGSTCCADPNYECRWSDDGQNVKRCQAIDWYYDEYAKEGEDKTKEAPTKTYVALWDDCSASDAVCADGNWCVQHSSSYWQCKPGTLGNGELCGQHDGTNEWDYPYCPTGQTCQPLGTDMRCA
ncbi:hypothetical protein PHYSODRAFT_259758 [Phytophthora sojae]|uniref:CBM1 domain-containing protein n=1 Tax=Phytophthora sojae (strain P6497) TaxID=1094619 RepID=G4Z2X1_PHYSP|nr:hypothetical protein PHYSODRAFT_259758 [Phytophthora sojae]EGZ19304.1 hypothetical protein PHYSODRAFT_259758 [Phytophthora sojae]|eukprot:XP_009522021.1 hypothetical protein PHYSODRAFT_259758 [Phytophthora sojae]